MLSGNASYRGSEATFKLMMSVGEDKSARDIKTDKIIKLLKSGKPQLPVFIEAGDEHNFAMEGRHRKVAFYLLKLPYIPVVYVSKSS